MLNTTGTCVQTTRVAHDFRCARRLSSISVSVRRWKFSAARYRTRRLLLHLTSRKSAPPTPLQTSCTAVVAFFLRRCPSLQAGGVELFSRVQSTRPCPMVWKWSGRVCSGLLASGPRSDGRRARGAEGGTLRNALQRRGTAGHNE
jgi:hypothetical protein